MDNTYKTIFGLIDTAINGSGFQPDADIDWKAVFVEMDKQKIAALVGSLFAVMNIDAELRNRWRGYIISQRMHYDQLLQEHGRVFGLLKGMPSAVIKGTAAAIYYPDPLVRTMGDIDILVGRECHDKGRKILQGKYDLDNSYEARHSCFRKGNVVIELHNRFGIKLESEKEGYFDGILFDALPYVEKHDIEGVEIPVLPKTENGLVILYHIVRHLQNGVGLRHVVDWMAYVSDSEPVDWEKFNMVSKKIGIYKFQCVITKTCEIYLGLRHWDDIDWCNYADTSLCEKLMEYVISRGNFGRAMDSYAGKYAMKNIRGNLFRRLQIGGLCRWKAAARHKVLRPFAWLYQIVRISKEILSRDNPIKSVKSDMKEAENVKKFLEELGLERSSAM